MRVHECDCTWYTFRHYYVPFRRTIYVACAQDSAVCIERIIVSRKSWQCVKRATASYPGMLVSFDRKSFLNQSHSNDDLTGFGKDEVLEGFNERSSLRGSQLKRRFSLRYFSPAAKRFFFSFSSSRQNLPVH